MHNYYDNWKTEEFDCSACKWHGVGSALKQGGLTGDYFVLLCPSCGEHITIVMNPTIEEAHSNWKNLSEDEREEVDYIERMRANFNELQLHESTPLPSINSPSFVLHWDLVNNSNSASYFDYETLIKYGDTIIFSEPGYFESYRRFIEVAKILRTRYGSALLDLLPTANSKLYLYGDRLTAIDIIDAARQEIFQYHSSNRFVMDSEMIGNDKKTEAQCQLNTDILFLNAIIDGSVDFADSNTFNDDDLSAIGERITPEIEPLFEKAVDVYAQWVLALSMPFLDSDENHVGDMGTDKPPVQD